MNWTKRSTQIVEGYDLLLLFYAKNIVFFAKSNQKMKAHLDALEDFCKHSRVQVNIDKTKVLVIGSHNKQIDVTFEGEPLETINPYKYLGLEFSDNNYKWNAFAISPTPKTFFGFLLIKQRPYFSWNTYPDHTCHETL